MQELTYKLSFNTPAFLGNAEQQAQWRTPPVKALIRQWWRVTQQARTLGDTERMRHAEGLQFGNAWLQDESGKPLHRKSDLLIRLSEPELLRPLRSEAWQQFQFDTVPTSREARLRADLYTGYGPVQSTAAGQGPRRIVIERGAIDVGKEVDLRLGTRRLLAGLDDTLRLLHWFGTLGGRSRNGWGSLRLKPENPQARSLGLGDALELAQRYSRDWRDAWQLDWPHAIGSDEKGPLLWKSGELPDWRAAIGRLARIRIAARLTAKRIRDRQSAAGGLHYLGYPAGTGPRNPWNLPLRDRSKPEPRLASPLRFKVIPGDQPGSKSVRLLAWHMPASLPATAFTQVIGRAEAAWLCDERNWLHTWQEIHLLLDEDADPMAAGKRLGLQRMKAAQ